MVVHRRLASRLRRGIVSQFRSAKRAFPIALAITPFGRFVRGGRLAQRALPFAGRVARGTGRAFLGTPKRALATSLLFPPVAGVLATPRGRGAVRAFFSPKKRFKLGQELGEDPRGTIAGLIKGAAGFGNGKPLKSDIAALERSAASMGFPRTAKGGLFGFIPTGAPTVPTPTLNIFGIGAAGAALGAGLLALATGIRERRAPSAVATVLPAASPIGAVQPPTEPVPVGAPALEMTVPKITVKVQPTIKNTFSPKSINILQASQ